MRSFATTMGLSLLFLCVASPVGEADPDPGQKPALPASGHCGNRQQSGGECYSIRARLRAYDGYPRCRLWPVGSNRLLGIPDAASLPSNIACGDGFEVYADYVVCPVSEPKPQGVQFVCVASATNIRASEIRPDNGKRH